MRAVVFAASSVFFGMIGTCSAQRSLMSVLAVLPRGSSSSLRLVPIHPTARTDLDGEISAGLQRTRLGSGGLHCPPEMSYGVKTFVVYGLGEQSVDQLKQVMLGWKELAKQNVKLEMQPGIPISMIMRAELFGDAFDIRLIEGEPDKVALDAPAPAKWVWEVVPRSSGDHELYLQLSRRILVRNLGRDFGDHEPVVVRHIPVRVNAKLQARDFLSKYWPFVITLIVPAGIGPSIWRWRRKKCPYCAELVRRAAQKCSHCGEWILSKPQSVERPLEDQRGEHTAPLATGVGKAGSQADPTVLDLPQSPTKPKP